MTLDHPHVRQDTTCPLCGKAKDTGLVACWYCYRVHDLRSGNPRAEGAIDRREIALAADQREASLTRPRQAVWIVFAQYPHSDVVHVVGVYNREENATNVARTYEREDPSETSYWVEEHEVHQGA
jgi:hypothetical protein